MSIDWFGFDVSGVLIPRRKEEDKEAYLSLKSFISSSHHGSPKSSPRRKR